MLADGIFYYTDPIPADIPYQRAILWFDGQVETLLVQTQYHISASAGDRFGWVVPVPAVPELASMDAKLADELFRDFAGFTRPTVIHLRELVVPALCLLIYLAAGLVLVACLFSLFVARLQLIRRHRRALALGALVLLVPIWVVLLVILAYWLFSGTPSSPLVLFAGLVFTLLVLLATVLVVLPPRLQLSRRDRAIIIASGLLLPAMFITELLSGVYFARGNATADISLPPVEVVKAESVGVYDIQVIRSRPTSHADELIAWLDDNGFRFDEEDRRVFDNYIARGWSFVVARIDPRRAAQPGQIVTEGLVAPLILRFPVGDAPVYPLALTATAGSDTQVLLYLRAEHKWAAGGRLTLQYAAENRLGAYMERAISQHAETGVDPADFFRAGDLSRSYFCKFTGTLSPEQMREDLVFTPAPDDHSYGKYRVVW